MTRIKTIHATFSGGEVSDGFEGRIDLDAYLKSARKVRNCYIDNIGFAFRREGLQYIDDVEGNVKPRLLPFQFNTEQVYLFEFTPGKLRVFEDDVEIDDITTSPIDALTADQIDEMDFTQSADTMILVHEDVEPIRITRTGATTFTADNLPLVNIPQHSYSDTVGSSTNEVMRMTFDYRAGASSFVFELEGERSDGVNMTGTSGATDAATIQAVLRKMKNTSATGITVSNTGTTIFDITFAGDDGGKNWVTPKLLDIQNLDSVSITSTTQGGPPEEDVWSSARGWPKSLTFFESRLWFGGSGSRPQTLWGSRVGDFFNFNVGSGLDDEAVDITIDDDQVNAITSVTAGRTLQVFTTGGEFAFLKNTDEAITPDNINLRKQTLHGSKRVRPVSVDGSTIFTEESGTVIREFVFNDVEQSFLAPDVSVLSSDLVRDIERMAVRKSTSEAAVSVVYMLNATDGTITVLNKLREQNLRAFSLFETEGTFEDVVVVGNDVYVAVERTINSVDTRQIEKLNSNFFLDGAQQDTDAAAKTLWTGFTELADQDVTVLGRIEPGQLYGSLVDNTVNGSGEITTEIDIKEIEIGFFFAAEIETLPVEALLGPVQQMGDWKRLVAVNVKMKDSRNLLIRSGRGEYLPNFRQMDTALLDTPIPLFDGWKKVYIGGVDRDVTVTITQQEPFEFEVLALAIEIAT